MQTEMPLKLPIYLQGIHRFLHLMHLLVALEYPGQIGRSISSSKLFIKLSKSVTQPNAILLHFIF